MWTSAILALVAVNLMLIGWRSNVVRWLPQTASLYAAIGLPVNLRGLVFANVTTERETHDGVEVLLVQGSIVNDFKRAAEVPRLRFSVRLRGLQLDCVAKPQRADARGVAFVQLTAGLPATRGRPRRGALFQPARSQRRASISWDFMRCYGAHSNC